MSKHLQIVTLEALLLELSEVEYTWNGSEFVNSNDPTETFSFDIANQIVAGTIIDLQNNS